MEYGAKKKYKIELLKEKDTIIKVLSILHKNKLININDIEFTEDHKSKININEIMVIECNTFMESQFIAIPEKLYIENIHRMGHIGWSIFCLLAKLHNANYGSTSSIGFANPTQEYIAAVIKRDVKCISAYSYMLESLKLIKIENQDPVFKGYSYDGEKIYDPLPNNYIVKFMDAENKYYIGA